MEQLDNDKEAMISEFHEALRFVVTVDDMFPPDGCGDRAAPEEPEPRPPLEAAEKLGELALAV